MEDKDSKLESVKLIKYAGRADRWREWSKKVIAYAKTKNFNLALTNYSDPKVTEKMKNDALNFLTMSLSGEAFSFVENADNSGDVWTELMEEYAPSDDNQIFDLQEEFLKCNLVSDDENPMFWFKRLEYFNSRLRAIDSKYIKSDDDLKIHVKSNLPSSIYSELIVAVRKDFKDMLWKDFKTEVRQHWRQWKRIEGKESKENIMMTNHDSGSKKFRKPWKNKQFKGRCRSCGKYGHKAADCPDKRERQETSEKKMRNVKCYKCGNYGHYANKCPNNKKNERNLFVGNVACNGEDDDESMVVTYDSDEEDDEIILIGEDDSNDVIMDDAETEENDEDTPEDMEIVMNVDEDELSMMDVEKKATDNKDATNDIEQLDREIDENEIGYEEDEKRMSKRFKNDETEWIRVDKGVLAVDYDKDVNDLQEINEKWRNQYEVFNDVEKMANVVRKLDLSNSDDESIEKLFEDDSSDEEVVDDSEKAKKKIKAEENEVENKENVPPMMEQNYAIRDMHISDAEENAESEDEIDLFMTKNRKRKRNKKRTKPRKRKSRENVKTRELNKKRLKENWLRIKFTIDEFVKGIESNIQEL